MGLVAVLDIGKTNVKLSLAEPDGTLRRSLSAPNRVRPGPPYPHHDVGAVEAWALAALAELGRSAPIDAIVACGHGSGGVLVDADGPVMPMIDYEAEPPAEIQTRYRQLAGSFRERGSAIMMGASHLARQMLWLQTGWPDAVARARHFLGLPQYWAWRFCGVAASEATVLGAQSHLLCPATGEATPIVAAQGWQRLLPPRAPAWATLGTLKPALARQTGLSPETRVLCGIHDSSANFYRYQAAGLSQLTVVSTGTWIVALSDAADLDALDEARGMSWNLDPFGRPLGGALTMAGREFALVAGAQPDGAKGDVAALAAVVGRGTIALPFFGDDDGLLPGRARKGRILGPPPEDAAERRALALLLAALLTDLLLDALAPASETVLDGSFTADPLYPALVAALGPSRRVRANAHAGGAAAGAALLAGHENRHGTAPISLDVPAPLGLKGLAAYKARWRAMSAG